MPQDVLPLKRMCGVLSPQHCGTSTVRGTNEDVTTNGSGTRLLLCLSFTSVDCTVFRVLGEGSEAAGANRFGLEASRGYR